MEQPSVLPVSPPPSSSSPRDQIAKQLTSGSTNPDASSSVFSQLSSNPFFIAGFGLAGLGVAARWGQKGLSQGAALLRRRMLVDVEITSHDHAYPWFLEWMSAHLRNQLNQKSNPSEHGTMSKIMRKLTPGMHHLSIETSNVKLANGADHTHFSLVPGPGNHILRYRNTFIFVTRDRETKNMNIQTGKPFETVKLTTLYSQRHIFEHLFTEAHALQLHATEGKTQIYTSFMTDWKPFGPPKRKRPIDSVVLAPGVAESLILDLRSFLNSRTWYLDRGIPYRRGYLLYGPPGTGKSSFIQALAGSLDFGIAMLNLAERGLTDDRLNHLLSAVPSRTILLLEDADAAFTNRRQQSDEHGYRGATVTFSGLLNALDGVASAEERIVFLTTNKVDALDPALVRPGRVDIAVRLGEATQSQVERLWDRFYADEHDHDGFLKRAFVERCIELGLLDKISTAALQGLFLVNKENPAGAIEMADVLLPDKGLTSDIMTHRIPHKDDQTHTYSV